MKRNRTTNVRDFIVKHSKLVFPVIVIAAVAVTVSVALNAGNTKAEQPDSEPSVSGVDIVNIGDLTQDNQTATLALNEDVPLIPNEDEQIRAMVLAYYNALVLGDTETMAGIYDELSDNDLLSCVEKAKYLDHLPAWEIYTKPGLEEGTSIVYVYYRLCFVNHEEEVPGWQTFYVCSNEDGELYFKNGKNLTEAENEYIMAVSGQDDVVEFNNRVSVEYNELIENHPELAEYLHEFRSQVNTAVGVALAERNANATEGGEAGEDPGAETGEDAGATDPAGEGQETPQDTPQPPASGPMYATATTTVNVRNSDSEQAEKLGKVTGGTRVEVQEVRLNGWTKIVFEGQEGYIKSEFLAMEESAAGQEVIGAVTATANINIRTAASQDSESMGIMTEGSSLDLLGEEGDWCKVNYEGRIGYVKAEYVTR